MGNQCVHIVWFIRPWHEPELFKVYETEQLAHEFIETHRFPGNLKYTSHPVLGQLDPPPTAGDEGTGKD